MSEAKFVASTHQGEITIARADQSHLRVTFSPSEAEKASAIVGMILSMVALPKVPAFIENPPFVVRIFPRQIYALERQDQKGSLPFRVREGDELIRTIDMGLGICLNEQTLGRAVPKGVPTTQNMPDRESF